MHPTELLLPFLLVAFLYASVGHAGASGYIAVMALWGFLPHEIKPTALCLNIVVALIAGYRFYRAGHFSALLFWPFAATSVPAAFLGGYLQLPVPWLKEIIGGMLLFSSFFIIWKNKDTGKPALPLTTGITLSAGAVIGFVSGLTGVGGGIFLSPLLIVCRWASMKTTAAVSAAFILVNSVAGLAGHLGSLQSLPEGMAWWIPAVVAGGSVGAWLGSTRFSAALIRALLALVLVAAGLKLVWGV
jgi:uncharacterized membrane protein YfcA